MKNFEIEFRWENFRSFIDTKWITIKPITIFIGQNGSGKTSLLQPFILLGQTLESEDKLVPLMTVGDYVNAGTFRDIVHNHITNQDIKFSIRFKSRMSSRRQMKEIGQNPPSFLSVSFSQESGFLPKLKRYIVRDEFGRLLLARSLKKAGGYTLKFCKSFPRKRSNEIRLYKNIMGQTPRHFVFDDTPIVRKEIESKSKRMLSQELKFPPAASLYLRVTAYIQLRLFRFLSSMKYLGPLRDSPKRFYEFRGEHHSEVGCRGQFIHSVLFHLKQLKNEGKSLDHWLKFFGLAKELKCNPIKQPGLIEILVKPMNSNFQVNVSDTGFGLSQLLPLIVQAVTAQEEDIIITEQPEIHLNPKLESHLADFFTSMIKEKKNFIIETHSEHFILRLRTLIKAGKVSPEDVAIYFTENTEHGSTVDKIEVDKNGEFIKNNWPKGFFEEALTESLRFITLKKR